MSFLCKYALCICYGKCNKIGNYTYFPAVVLTSSPIGTSDENPKFYQIFWLFCIIFILNGEFEYQIDYLSQ